MKTFPLFKLSVVAALACGLQGSLTAALPGESFDDSTTSVSRKYDVQTQLIEKALNILRSIDLALEELALSTNNGSIKVADKKLVVAHITKIRDFVAQQLSKDTTIETLADCISANNFLIAHVDGLIESHLRVLPPFDGTEATSSAALASANLLAMITSHEEKMVEIWGKVRHTGKTVLPRFLTKAETWLKDSGVWNAGKRALPYIPLVLYINYRSKLESSLKKTFTGSPKPAQLDEQKHVPANASAEESLAKIATLLQGQNAPKPSATGSLAFKLDTISLDLLTASYFGALINKDYKDFLSWSHEKGKHLYALLKGETYEDPSPVKKSKLKFSDIVGYAYAKEQINHLVGYFDNKNQYDRTGTFPDRGYLFVGPLDMGKDLAHALAGEITLKLQAQGKKCGIRDLHSSELVKKDIKDIIEETEKESGEEPVILLINDLNWLTDKSEKDKGVLGSLATAMSKTLKGNKKKIFIVATTQDAAAIDKTLSGSGRLGSTVHFDKPTQAERAEFFAKELAKRGARKADFDVQNLAFLTDDCSYDALTAIVKAAFARATSQAAITTQAHIKQAIDAIIHKIAYNDTRRDAEQEVILAQCFAGQTLVHYLLEPRNELVKVTILPVASAQTHALSHGKLITHAVDNKQEFTTAKDLEHEAVIALAGVEAVKLLGNEPTIAMIQKADLIARTYAKRIVFQGASEKDFDKKSRDEKLAQVSKLMNEFAQQAQALLTKHQNKLATIAAELKEKLTLDKQELMTILNH